MMFRSATVSVVLAGLSGLFVGCGSESGSPSATGGSPGAGGGLGSSGSLNASGTGNLATGGALASGGASGGGPSSGGAVSSGGLQSSGGVSSGGAANGGVFGSGGSGTNSGGLSAGGAASGGTSAAGGSGGGFGGRGGKGGASSGGMSAGGAMSSGGASSGGASTGTGGGTGSGSAKFSFFVTSLEAMRRLSKNQNGFGGDFRYGEADGLAGADKICTEIAESSMPGSGAKGWRAFLSTSKVNAIDRVGMGPWYDREGRLVATGVQGLLRDRPDGDAAVVSDLPNESGVPNRAGTGGGMDDNHDTVTGTNTQGKWDGGSTCSDWTSTTTSGGPRVGHSWPANSGRNWMQAHNAPGCAPGVNLSLSSGAGSGNGIGNGGGYGGIYCFALMP
ncbi:MAG TPA: hypothetical protein VFQ61_12545 [Polyangiaceae bacterium]|nr:hypothetical protein [Polyangiaceae bacterium]